MAQLKREGGGNRAWRKNEGADWGKADGSWVTESVRARKNILESLYEDMHKSAKMGERLRQVWEKEKELWKEERGRRKHDKNVARKERKRATSESEAVVKDDEGDKGKAGPEDEGDGVERTLRWAPI